MIVGLLLLLGLVTACGETKPAQAFKMPAAHSYAPARVPTGDAEEKVNPPSNISGASY